MDLNNVGSEERAAQKLKPYLGRDIETPAAIRPQEILWIVAFFLLFAVYLDATDVSQNVVAEKRAQIEGCIAQFGPGEYHRNPALQCAPMVEAPVTAMTRPIQ